MKKVKDVFNSSNVEHYKNLRYDMKNSKGVHIGQFVLIFSYDKAKDFVSFEDDDPRDMIYR
jgi:mRNA-degrading endonuclease RelE of RelBE toxin-antitoxin system